MSSLRAAVALVAVALLSVEGSVGVALRGCQRDWITSVVAHLFLD